MSGISVIPLASAGQTGNNTHASIALPEAPARLAFALIVTAIGAGPTVTWKVQVSADPPDVTDANSTWVDLIYFTAGTNDTLAVATRAVTTVSRDTVFLDDANGARFFRKARLVTTLNTNVTYRGECVAQARN